MARDRVELQYIYKALLSGDTLKLVEAAKLLKDALDLPLDSNSMVLVPRSLLAAACGAVVTGCPVPNIIEKLRRYTTGEQIG
jgi:hypothetical protein